MHAEQLSQCRTLVPAEVVLVAFPHPLKMECVRARVPAGQSLSALLGEQASDDITALVDGRHVPRELWAHTHPRAGAVVVASRLPQGSDTLSSVVQIATLAALTWVGGLGFGAVATFGLQLGVGYLGSMAHDALVPPPEADAPLPNPPSADRFTALTGTRNQAAHYEQVVELFGTHRYFPPMAARGWTEIRGQTRVRHMLMDLGPGPMTVHAVQFGDSPIEQFEGVSVARGAVDDSFQEVLFERGLLGFRTPDKLLDGNVVEDQVQFLFDEVGLTATRTTAAETDEIGLNFVWPNGLWAVQSNDGRNAGDSTFMRARYLVEYRKVGDEAWTNVWSNGELRGAGVWEPVNEVMKNAPNGFPGSTSPISALADSFDDDPRRVLGGLSWPVERGQYEVRVKLTDAQPWQLAQGRNYIEVFEGFWGILRSRKKVVPVRRDTWLLRVSIPEDTVAGTLERVNVIATRWLPRYTNPQNPTTGQTRNPAWAFIHVLTGPQSPDPVPMSKLDMTELVAWASDCDAKGLEYNQIMDSGGTLRRRLDEICAAGRASFAWRDGKYSVVREPVDAAPVGAITPRNSSGSRIVRTHKRRPHALRVRYTDMDTWQPTEVIVYDEGFNEASAWRFEVLQMPWAGSADRAAREGRYRLAEMRLRPEVHERTVGIQQLRFHRGSVVSVSDDVALWGNGSALIRELTVNAGGYITHIRVDEPLTMTAGKDYVARVMMAETGEDVILDIITEPGTTDTLALAEPSQAALSEQDLLLFGEQGAESVPMVITRIEPTARGDAKLKLQRLAPELATIDDGATPDYQFVPLIDPNPPLPVPVITDIRGGWGIARLDGQGTLSAGLEVAFVVDGLDNAQVRAVQGEIREKNSRYFSPTKRKEVSASDAAIIWRGLDFDTEYDVRLRTVGRDGGVSPWTPLTTDSTTTRRNLEDTSPGVPLMRGLQIKNQPHDPEWRGKDLKLACRKSGQQDWSEWGEETRSQGAGHGALDRWMEGYEWQVWPRDEVPRPTELLDQVGREVATVRDIAADTEHPVVGAVVAELQGVAGLSFNASTTSGADLGNNARWDLGTDSAWIRARVQSESAGHDMFIAGKKSSTDESDAGWLVGHSDGFSLSLALISDGTSQALAVLGDVRGQALVEVDLIIDRGANELRAYVDGALVDTTDITGLGSLDNTASARIASLADGTNDGWDGFMSDVIVRKGVVPTAAEIEAAQGKRLHGNEAGVVSYVPMAAKPPRTSEPLRTEITSTPRFTYTHEMNVEDAGPRRRLLIEGRLVARTGARSDKPAVLRVENPPPGAAQNVKTTPGWRAITLEWDPDAALDRAGARVWIGTSAGFEPDNTNLIYDGPDTEHVLTHLADQTRLNNQTEYFIKIQEYDTFGKDGAPITSVAATTLQVKDEDIEGLTASKILAGTIEALVEMVSPIIRFGKDQHDDTSAGFWIGVENGQPVLHFGDEEQYIRFDQNGMDLGLPFVNSFLNDNIIVQPSTVTPELFNIDTQDNAASIDPFMGGFVARISDQAESMLVAHSRWIGDNLPARRVFRFTVENFRPFDVGNEGWEREWTAYIGTGGTLNPNTGQPSSADSTAGAWVRLRRYDDGSEMQTAWQAYIGNDAIGPERVIPSGLGQSRYSGFFEIDYLEGRGSPVAIRRLDGSGNTIEEDTGSFPFGSGHRDTVLVGVSTSEDDGGGSQGHGIAISSIRFFVR